MAVDLPNAAVPGWTGPLHKTGVRHDSIAETTPESLLEPAQKLAHPSIMDVHTLGGNEAGQAEKDALLQERYLSSEEELSPVEPDLSDSSSMLDIEDEDPRDESSDMEDFEIMEAVQVAAKPVQSESSFRIAVLISVLAPGKAKMVDIPRPRLLTRRSIMQFRPKRISSLNGLSAAAAAQATPNTRPVSLQRPSPIRTSGLQHPRHSAVKIVDISTPSTQTPTANRGSMLITPAELYSTRPRFSTIPSTSSTTSQGSSISSSSQQAPPSLPTPTSTPSTPLETPTSAKTPRSSRLRGFSKTLSIARFVVNGKHASNHRDSQQSLRKASSIAQMAEQAQAQAQAQAQSQAHPHRTQSPSSDYMSSLSSTTSASGTTSPASPLTPDTATMPTSCLPPPASSSADEPPCKQRRSSRMVARAADERSPAIALPPFADHNNSEDDDGDCEGSVEDLRALHRSNAGSALAGRPPKHFLGGAGRPARRLRRVDSLERMDIATFLAGSN